MDDLDRAIAADVERREARIVGTLGELIAFPSVVPTDPQQAGPAERDCQHYLQARLHDLGFTTDLWDPDGPALFAKYQGRPGAHAGRTFEGRPILAGRLAGGGGGRSIMLTGHIDVVPPGAAAHWRTDPFVATLRDGRLHGRGAVDMKGGVACMLEAVAVLRERGVRLAGDMVFATVVDEEIGGMGALALVDRGWRADAGILPESTGLAISPICHGILWGHILI
jgi:acetylornithine deacetylase